MVAQQRTLAELTSSGDDAVSGLDKARANALTLVAETVEAVGVRAAA